MTAGKHIAKIVLPEPGVNVIIVKRFSYVNYRGEVMAFLGIDCYVFMGYLSFSSPEKVRK